MLFFCVFGLKIELCRTNRPVPVNGGGDLLTDRGLQRTPDVVGRRCCRRTSPDCRRPRSSLGVVGRLQAADVDRRLGRPPSVLSLSSLPTPADVVGRQQTSAGHRRATSSGACAGAVSSLPFLPLCPAGVCACTRIRAAQYFGAQQATMEASAGFRA